MVTERGASGRVWSAALLIAACPAPGGETTTSATTSASGSTAAGTSGSSGASDPTSTSTSADPTTGGPATSSTSTPSTTGATDTTTGGEATSVVVHLVPQAGIAGVQRINFAVPLPPGLLSDAAQIQVRHEGVEVPAALRGLARHPEGSWRSVQVQVDLDIPGETDLEVALNSAPSAGTIDAVPVEDTLIDDASGPRVWALLPADWLSASGLAGPLGTEAEAEGTPGVAWAETCDYAAWGHDAFIPLMGQADVWLYDRGTLHYRGHARRGDLGPLRSAYLETTIYRNGLTGTGPDTEIGVPGKAGDAKYYYAQNLALHYLMTGDDRFRESAEDVAEAFAALWPDPGYAGGADFWTERHAGFALLAYVWAMIVSDDQAAQFRGLADEAVAAYLDVQETYPLGYADPDARCFAHSDEAAGEGFGYFGCSPWLSAILADGLDQYATESAGAAAESARTSLVKLGRIVARDGLDMNGKPFYWMGVGDGNGAVDNYDEHWGESAYVVALAYVHSGASDPDLKAAADALVDGFSQFAEVPHMRSFNWQCRSAVATPRLLAQ